MHASNFEHQAEPNPLQPAGSAVSTHTPGPGATGAPAPAQARRWLLWAWGPADPVTGKRPKVPWYVHGGRRGHGIELDSPEDVAQFASYEEACAKLAQPLNPYAGLGFALGGRWQGVDFDDVHGNHLHALANAVPSYVELSPSGRGCHAIGYGAPFDNLPPNGSGLEAYSSRRFFTFTSRVIRPGPICCLAGWVAQHVEPRHASSGHSGDLLPDPADAPQERSDDEVIGQFWHASNAEPFRALWHGDMRAYANDHSRADQALMTQLAFYTPCNNQLVRLWRASALGQRDKAYRDDYVRRTVTRARATHAPRLKREAAMLAIRPGIEAAIDQALRERALLRTPRPAGSR